MTRLRAVALVIALTAATWFSLNGIRHLINDHTLIHQLVNIEIARQQAASQQK